jgi:hypothetical protein
MKIKYDGVPDSIGVEGFGKVFRGQVTEVPDAIAESLLRKQRLGFRKVEDPGSGSRKKKEE